MNSPQSPMASTQIQADCLSPQGRRLRGALSTIIAEVAAECGLTVADISGLSRKKNVIAARQLFYYRAMMETDRPCTVIGRHCNRDGTTVMAGSWRHSVRRGLSPARGVDYGQWRKWNPNGG